MPKASAAGLSVKHSGDMGLVQKLTQEGIDVDMATNSTKTTALYLAAMRGNLPILQYLLQHSADKDKADNDSITPLFAAVAKGHLAVVQCLLEHGAERTRTRPTTNDGFSPLFMAAQLGHLSVVQCLLERTRVRTMAFARYLLQLRTAT